MESVVINPNLPAEVQNLPEYGAIYGEEESNLAIHLEGGGMDIEGMVGDDVSFAVFFNYTNLTGYTFTAHVALSLPPLKKTWPMTVSVTDQTVGLISVSIPKVDTAKIGPVARKAWFLNWTDTSGKLRTIMMGYLSLNRVY
jgi:hypothetical protein